MRVVPRCKAIDNIALTQYDQTFDWARRVIAILTARGDRIAAYANSRPMSRSADEIAYMQRALTRLAPIVRKQGSHRS